MNGSIYTKEICTKVVNEVTKLAGTADRLVKVQESYFSGKRKCHSGRVLALGRRIDLQGINSSRLEGQSASDDEEFLPSSSRNYAYSAIGPLLLGLCKSNEKERFLVTGKRKSTIRCSLMQEHI